MLYNLPRGILDFFPPGFDTITCSLRRKPKLDAFFQLQVESNSQRLIR